MELRKSEKEVFYRTFSQLTKKAKEREDLFQLVRDEKAEIIIISDKAEPVKITKLDLS